MSDGASFGIDLGVTGGDQAVSAAAAMDALASKLQIAGVAATAASEAQKAGQVAYNQAETAANRAALAVEKIGLAADAQKGKAASVAEEFGLFSPQFQKASDKLAALNARQAEAAAKAAATSAAMNASAASLDTLKSTASAAADNVARLNQASSAASAAAKSAAAAARDQATAEQKVAKEAAAAAAATAKAGKGTGEAGEAAGGSAVNFRALSSGLGKLGGPLGSIGSQAAGVGGAIQKLGSSLGAAGPYVAAAVAAFAVATAFAAAAFAITAFAVSSADAARTQALLTAGIAGSVAGGKILGGVIDSIADRIPLTTSELQDLSKPLIAAGLQGSKLSDALETAAVKAATVKFGPDFAKQMNSLPNLTERLKNNFSKIFSGLNIEGLLSALASMVQLFDSGSASSGALKTVFESLFQPIVDGITSVIPKMVSMFIQFEILALKALIAIKPFGTQLEYIGIAFGILAVICVAAVVIIIAILVALCALPALIIAFFINLAKQLGEAWDLITAGASAAFAWITGVVSQAMDFFQGLSLSQIGSDLIDGLVNGIMSAGPKVLSAITGLASGAIDAAKKALGIASPSKIFAEIGMHTAAGMEQGVDGGADAVQGSMAAMVDPSGAAAAGAGAGAAAASGAPASGGGGLFAGAIFNFNGVGGDAKSFAEEFRDHITDLMTTGGASNAPAT